MLDPSAPVSVGQLISTLKDGAFLIGICVAGWKARGIVQPAIDFFNKASKHMEKMEHFADTVMSNHLVHMESDLRTIAGRKQDVIEVDDSQGSN